MKPKQPCGRDGCSALVVRGYCRKHQFDRGSWGRGNKGNARSTAMRTLVLREEPLCRYCGKARSTVVDHMIPLSQGGGSYRGNLTGSCKPCHDRKTGKEAQQARRARVNAC